MSLIFAIASRWHSGKNLFRSGIAVAVFFLGWSTVRAQQARTSTQLAPVVTRTTTAQRFTNAILLDALRSQMTAPATNVPVIATNLSLLLSTNTLPHTNTPTIAPAATKPALATTNLALKPSTNTPPLTKTPVITPVSAKAPLATTNLAPRPLANTPPATNTLANTRVPTNAPITTARLTTQPPITLLRYTNTVHITNFVNFTNTVRVTELLRLTNTVYYTNTERFTNTLRLAAENFTNTVVFTNTERITNMVLVTNTVVLTNTVLAASAPSVSTNVVAVSPNAPLVTTNFTAPVSAATPPVSTNVAPPASPEAIASSPNTSVPPNAPSITTNFTAQPSTTASLVTTNLTAKLPTNTAPSPELTTQVSQSGLNESGRVVQLRSSLEDARRLRLMRQPQTAEPVLVSLLADDIPETIQQSALLELALVAQDENNLVRAQQIYAQFVSRWPNDARAPEVFLHQGQLFRQMGLNSLALAKFYSVMTAALSIKNDQLAYYQKLVLDAQMEIAETHYQSGRYAEAADFFSRLLKQNNPALNHPEIQFRLIRSLQASGNQTETAAQAFDFLTRFPNSPNEPEVRFCLAVALKDLGRNTESLQQVLALLKEQKAQSKEHPEVWAYWQQRTGNEIANQLYREGDFPKALDIYLSLEQLDHSAAWQLPLKYQIGMTYERLLQPELAMQSYSNIVNRQTDLGTNASPGLKAMVDMANWRINFIKWQSKADNVNKALAEVSDTKPASKKTTRTTATP